MSSGICSLLRYVGVTKYIVSEPALLAFAVADVEDDVSVRVFPGPVISATEDVVVVVVLVDSLAFEFCCCSSD